MSERMMFLKLLTCVLVLASFLPETSYANFIRGWAAYQRHDYVTAYREIRRAAEQGHLNAQFELGIMYTNALGVSKNEAEALRWFRRAAEQGHVDAQGNLGVMYAEGFGVSRNDAEAVRWYRRAAEQGYANAQGNLGGMYAEGRGAPKNMVRAYMWKSLSAAQGIEYERRNLATYELQMTREQIAEAQRLAAAFRPRPETPAVSGGVSVRPSPQIVVSPTVRSIQRSLASLGYDPGPADGLMGPRTIRAIQAFQRDTGIEPDGVPSTTLEALLAAVVLERQKAAPSLPQAVEVKLSSTGTGFFVSREGHVLTNQHVIEDCQTVRVALPFGGHEARLQATHKDDDLAVLQTDITTQDVVLFRRSAAALGEDVAVAGYPLRGLLSGMNLTTGTVSSTSGLGGDARYLQITAPVQPGNSGGPLLDSSGAVVGVVVAKLDAMAVARATGDIPQNVNFAIKGAVAKSFLSIHGIPYVEATGDAARSRTVVASEAQRHTVLVECWK